MRQATARDWHLHHVAAVHGSDGNAILSRYPMLAREGRKLTRARSVAQATIDVGGTPVNVFSTHIESGKERASRAEQVQLLLPYLERFAPPRIVNADLNAGPDAAEIQPLLARGARIDYILLSDDGVLRVAGCELPDQRDRANVNVRSLVGTTDDKGVRPSDHNLVSCTLAGERRRPRMAAARPRRRQLSCRSPWLPMRFRSPMTRAVPIASTAPTT